MFIQPCSAFPLGFFPTAFCWIVGGGLLLSCVEKKSLAIRALTLFGIVAFIVALGLIGRFLAKC